MELKSRINIAGRAVGDNEPVFVIAEMACGHQGDFETALKLVDAAVDAKADCIQLQLFEPTANMAPSAPSYGLLEKLYFTPDQWREITEYTREFDISVSIFAYDEPSLDLALDLKPDLLKLNSSELSNTPMLINTARSGLPFTLGTGASTINEIKKAVHEIHENGGENLILMHGVQNFPTPIDTANIAKIRRLKDEFGGIIIYADHTNANEEIAKWIDLMAISAGAAMVEKHIILSRKNKGVDWQAALEPNEFCQYVACMRAAYEAIGPYEFQPFTDGDRKYRQFQKKSMVAFRNIKKGEKLGTNDVKYLRVQSNIEGIAPCDFDTVALGRELLRDVKKFEQILPTDLS